MPLHHIVTWTDDDIRKTHVRVFHNEVVAENYYRAQIRDDEQATLVSVEVDCLDATESLVGIFEKSWTVYGIPVESCAYEELDGGDRLHPNWFAPIRH